MPVRRRQLLTGAAGLSLLWSPLTGLANPALAGSATAPGAGNGAGHDAYFAQLNRLLKARGPGHPVMLLDRSRVDFNTRQLVASVGREKTYRVVVKSLPSVPLLKQVMTRADTQALMVFHQPFLNTLATTFAHADVLLGKPMPVNAAATFYRNFARSGHARFAPAQQVQWLIDTHERLLQYQQLARQLGVKMRVNFELDVGLRRGGLTDPAQLRRALAVVAADPKHLQVSGLMGYEAHLTGLQADLRHPAVQQVLNVYRGFVETLASAGFDPASLTLNGAGSHTLKIYAKDHTMNDLAAGSGVVMPTDFDTHHLSGHLPALFIAAPILKRYDRNPFMPDATEHMRRLYYIYGGYWKAQMASPAEVGETIYQSTNQSPIATSERVDLQVDDYMFLRPTQSEAVMLQFGDLVVVDQGEWQDRWPVFHQTS